jgi:hypothetical protein
MLPRARLSQSAAGGHPLFVNRDPEQPRAGATIRGTEKEQAMARGMSPKRAAAPELAQVFHTDRDRGA